MFIYQYDSPLGLITAESRGDALCGLWLEGQKYFPSNLPDDYEKKLLDIFEETGKWLDIYFSGKEPDFTPPLFFDTTPFRHTVWDILLTIPYGKTMTYGEIAEKIAEKRGINKMSAQAVGGAVGHNPISIIVPCHRVIGSDGKLTGYAGGLDKKEWLLSLESGNIKK